MLRAHVLYLGKLQHAVLLRLVQRVAGGVGVHVHLERLVVLADDKAVADAVEVGPVCREIDVGILLAHDEHRVEGEGDILRVENVKGAALGRVYLALLRRGDDLPAQRGEHGADDDHIAHAARVHDAGLLEHGVLIYRVGKRVLAGLYGAHEHVFKACPGLGGLDRGGGGQTRHREDGALGRLHDGLVRRVHAVGHSPGKFDGPGGLRALEALGDAAEEKRQNDAGIAARAAQQGGGDAVRRLVHGDEAALAQLSRRVAESQAHVRAGVAVGNGEHVEFVYLLYIRPERRVRTQYHLFERGGINIIFQLKVPPELIR